MGGPALREGKRFTSLPTQNGQPALVSPLLALSIKWEQVYDTHSARRPAPESSLEIANTILPWGADSFPSLEVFMVAAIHMRLA